MGWVSPFGRHNWDGSYPNTQGDDMGIYILSGGGRSDDRRLSRRRISSRDPLLGTPYSQPLPPNPNPLRFAIERVKQTGRFLAALITYPDCTNYEGRKIIVFEGLSEADLHAKKSLDPHFYEGGSIIARFRPDDQGWHNALLLMRTLSE